MSSLSGSHSDPRRIAAGQRARHKAAGKKKLPPYLLPGIARRRKRNNAMVQRFVVVGAFVFLGLFLTTVLLTAVSTVAAVGGTVEAYRRINADLPNAAVVTVDTFQTSRIYDRNGKLLQEIEAPDGGWRTFVALDQVSQYMIDATVAAEDATFWSHQGVEPMAILRGVTINLSGDGSSGGSTITQQLARGLYPEEIGYDISLTRKFKEALAAIGMDQNFSKQDILTMYLNLIFYGQRSYGIEAAAQTFFNKHASELTLAEASMLAGLPQAPSWYDPTVRLDQAKLRQKYVLDQMVKYNYITREEADEAYNTPLQPQTRTSEVQGAPHFTQYVKDYVREKYGDDAFVKGGLQIWTSIDLDLQAEAEQIVQENMPFLNAYRRNNAAMVVMVPYTGEVLAMVGSADFNDPTIGGQINYALANIQPGSSIKPVIYAAAFESGWNPGTVVIDDTMRVETPGAPEPYYEPRNYTGLSYGAVPVRTALSNSLNIPAVKAIQYAGVEHAYDLARRMGIKTGMPESPENYGLSLALGSGEIPLLEHTNVYATFANEGKYVAANPILKITDSNGTVLYELDRDTSLQNAPQALSPEIAYQVTSILTDDEARSMVFGRGNLFEDTGDRLGRPVAAKSGTTDNWKDIWTMGYTTDVAIGVWTGQTSQTGAAESELPQLDGIQGAGPIWQQMMDVVHNDPTYAAYLNGPNGQPIAGEWSVPPGLEQTSVCTVTGHQASGGSGETTTEWLIKDGGPALPCDRLSAYELEQLTDALKDIETNSGKYAGDGVSSILRYARQVGVYSGDIPEFDDDSEESDYGEYDPDDEEVPIVSRDG
ncbi:MAG: transglycosylase domain-containing protein [Thermomicrobiales bacterium]|nr:transglycosylase domain-containing protein [Thermomicrobiales bacterium]